jgi:hypothetical protein
LRQGKKNVKELPLALSIFYRKKKFKLGSVLYILREDVALKHRFGTAGRPQTGLRKLRICRGSQNGFIDLDCTHPFGQSGRGTSLFGLPRIYRYMGPDRYIQPACCCSERLDEAGNSEKNVRFNRNQFPIFFSRDMHHPPPELCSGSLLQEIPEKSPYIKKPANIYLQLL